MTFREKTSLPKIESTRSDAAEPLSSVPARVVTCLRLSVWVRRKGEKIIAVPLAHRPGVPAAPLGAPYPGGDSRFPFGPALTAVGRRVEHARGTLPLPVAGRRAGK
jgi:hypothetical protein